MRTPLKLIPAFAAVAAFAAGVTTTTATASTDSAAKRLAHKQVEVRAKSLNVYRAPAKVYRGRLERSDHFNVRRLSPSEEWAYGYAHGAAKTPGWVRTAGLRRSQSSGSGGGTTSKAPRLIHTPSARYAIERNDRLGRYVEVSVVLRTKRALTDAQRHAIAAPKLRHGDAIPDRSFSGLTLRTIGDENHCYVGEASQLRQRSKISDRVWRLGVFEGDRVTSNTKRIKLKRDESSGVFPRWQRRAAKRLGC